MQSIKLNEKEQNMEFRIQITNILDKQRDKIFIGIVEYGTIKCNDKLTFTGANYQFNANVLTIEMNHIRYKQISSQFAEIGIMFTNIP
jgi:translation elongation factor EF-1alpha